MPITKRERIPWGAAAAIVGIFVLVGVAYAAYAAYPILRGPVLSAESREVHGMVTVSGTSERVAKFTLNGLPVPLSESGTFSIVRAYPPGYTVMVMRAEDRFGRSLERTISLLVTNPPLIHGSEEESSTSTPESG